MAMIYDLVTGTVTTDEEYTSRRGPAPVSASPEPRLQSVAEATSIEEMAPVDAYMVMLQDILKKL